MAKNNNAKIVVITGGTSGIGLELKRLYEKDGNVVITISTRESDDLLHYPCSVADEKKIKSTIDKIGENYGRIDVLINNAGFGMSGITELLPNDKVKELVDVNFYGTLYCVQSALKYMRRGGKIINMSSAMALFPVPFRSIYGSVKSAVLSLSFSLRMEIKDLGIDVVAICPGDIKTNFTKNRIKQFETNERYGERLKKATIKSDGREEKRMSALTCAKGIYKKVKKKKCKPFYIIGAKYKLLYFLTNITPKSWLLNITEKLYAGK